MSAFELSHQKSLSFRYTRASSREVRSSLLLNFSINSRYCYPLRFSLSLLSISLITISISINHIISNRISSFFSFPKTKKQILFIDSFRLYRGFLCGQCEHIITITAIMIKRNAQRNVLNDKYAFKYRTKQYGEDSFDGRHENRRMDLELSHDENGRLTSNNKKYHQYKEEKEMKHKKIEGKNDAKSAIPLAEIRAEHNYTPPLSKERGLLKRQYQYDANQYQYDTNHKVQEKQTETKHIVVPEQSQRKRTNPQHNLSFNQMANHPPQRKKVQSQSIQKEVRVNERINPKFVRPNLDADVFSTERKYERRSYQKLNYNPSQNFKLARNYEKLEEPTDRTLSFTPLRQQIPPILTQTRHQSSFGPEEMSQRLKQISNFNDQINERIKSIIGSFMSLKGKL